MNEDEHPRRTAENAHSSTAQTTAPMIASPASGRTRSLTRFGIPVAAGLLAVAGLAILSSDRNPMSTRTPAAPTNATVIDRFIIDGMNVAAAAEHPDGESGEIWLNTPSDDPQSALPAIFITTGNTPLGDVSDWEPTGRSVQVLGQKVPVRSLNGDPLAVTWRIRGELRVTLVGEGFEADEFEARVATVRRMSVTEWQATVQQAILERRPPTRPPTSTMPD